MAFQAARKRKSDEMENVPNTPTLSTRPKRMKITQTQKQALIDNLQLEITERARQLRAHYALQCQDLKARIERRINRVPVGMRNMKMADLMAQHEKASKGQTERCMDDRITNSIKPVQAIVEPESRQPALIRIPEQQQQQPKIPSPLRKPLPQSNLPSPSRKRKSSAIQISLDKENDSQAGGDADNSNTAIESDSLPVQKNTKRAKTTATAAAPKRTISKTQKKPPPSRSKDNDGQTGILSPRSHNSRTLPRSPIKDVQQLPPSPTKTTHFMQNASPKRLQSPHRPVSPLKSAATAATSAFSAFAKRGAAAAANLRPSSRDKETAAAASTAIGTLASPTGKMLPPARPALATITSSSAHAVPTLQQSRSAAAQSPQRTVSQSSNRSAGSEQSTTSTNGTIVMKADGKSTANPKKNSTTAKARVGTATKKTAVTSAVSTATATKSKIAVSETVATTIIAAAAATPLSPKTGNTRGGMKRAATTAAARATAAVKRAGTLRKAATATATTEVSSAAETGNGRVLRKRY